MLGNCEICGCYWQLDKHHLLSGSDRKHAEEDGLYIYICRSCHNAIHADRHEELHWKKEGERRFLKNHTLTEWFDRYTKNFLEWEEIEEIENEKEIELLERIRNEQDFFDRQPSP